MKKLVAAVAVAGLVVAGGASVAAAQGTGQGGRGIRPVFITTWEAS